MANLNLVKVVCVAVLCMVVAAPHAEAGMTCGIVARALSPCINYLEGKGTLPANCCGGVRSLVSSATTPSDRKTACGCLKSLAGGIKGLNQATAAGLPGKCGVTVGYPISTSTDCSKVH